jgi:outer membrane protein OmpA-like peptidoglycan-associated protein
MRSLSTLRATRGARLFFLSAVAALLSTAPVPVVAQSSGATHPHETAVSASTLEYPSRAGHLSIGLFPTTRWLRTSDVPRNIYGLGATGLVGYHITERFVVEGSLSSTWTPQVNITDMASPNTMTPILAGRFTVATMHHGRVLPFIVAGMGRDVLHYRRGGELGTQRVALLTGHYATGLEYRLSYRATMRAEAQVQAGTRRPAWGGMMGLSLVRGLAAPPRTPAMRTEVVRHDTIRVITEIPVRDTLWRPAPGALLMTIPDVYFAFGKAELQQQDLSGIDSLAARLQSTNSAGFLIDVTGFTDDIGSDAFNLQLGLARAQSVQTYLVSRGIAMERIQIRSGGKSNPVGSNETEEGRARNRRVEIRRRND